MAGDLRIMHSDIPLNAYVYNPISTYDDDMNAFNSIAGEKYTKAAATGVKGTIVQEYDVGSGLTKSAEFLAIARADLLVASEMQSFSLKGSSTKYQYPASLTNLKVWLKSNHFVTYNFDYLVSDWTAFARGGDDTSITKVFTQATTANKPKVTRSDNLANWFLTSKAFDGSDWTKANVTISANTTANPLDGTVNADTMIENGLNALHQINPAVIEYIAIKEQYRLSVYAKQGSGTRHLVLNMGLGFGSSTVRFDLTGGTVVSATGVDSSSIESLGSGWYRCTAIDTATASGVNGPIINMYNGASSTYLGDSTSSIIIYGAQFCEATCDSTYLETNGDFEFAGANGCQGIKFHNTDNLSLAGAQISDGGDFTAFLALRIRGGSGVPSMKVISDEISTTSGTSISIDAAIGGPPYRVTVTTSSGGAQSTRSSSASLNIDQVHIISVVQSSGTCTIYLDGSSIGSGALTNCAVPSAAYSISDATNFFLGEIFEVINYNIALGTSDRQAIEEMLKAEWVRTPTVINHTLSNSDLTGTTLQDYVSTFATSTAYRYWWLEVSSVLGIATIAMHSKAFFGTPFDFNTVLADYSIEKVIDDAQFVATTGEKKLARSVQPHLKFKLTWENVTDDKVRDFSTTIANHIHETGFFLHTTSYHDVLDDKRLVYCKIVDWGAETLYNKVDLNRVTIEFEEQLG